MRDSIYYAEQAARALRLAETTGVKSLSDRLYEVAADYLGAAERLRGLGGRAGREGRAALRVVR